MSFFRRRMGMRASLGACLGLLMMLGAATSRGESPMSPPPALQKTDCLGCHAPDKQVVGPSFQAIAGKYTLADLPALSKKVKEGGAGAWGQMPMIPHPALADEDIRAIVTWILEAHKP